MTDTTQTTDFQSTIHLLEQDLSSVDPALAILMIERWEERLQGTEIFGDLVELKQAILNGNMTNLEKFLGNLSQKTLKIANSLEAKPAENAKQIATLLSEKSG